MHGKKEQDAEAIVMIKAFLQGKWLGHPLHVALVHLPIGLFLVSLLCDVLSYVFYFDYSNRWVRSAFYTLALGVATALLAAIPGIADYSDIRRDRPGRAIATYHMLLNLAAVVVFGAGLAIRWMDYREADRTWVVALLVSLIGNGLIAVSGYLGGILVYDEGIGVGRHRRNRAETIPPTVDATTAGSDGYARIGSVDEFVEARPVRACVNGHAIAIVKLGDAFRAVQDYCTHRGAPLSEGKFANGRVECPWHKSCFDLASGAVVEGPAKVELKTFDVVVRDGAVHVRVTP